MKVGTMHVFGKSFYRITGNGENKEYIYIVNVYVVHIRTKNFQ